MAHEEKWAEYDAAISFASGVHLPGTVFPYPGDRSYKPPRVVTNELGRVTLTSIWHPDYERQIATGPLVRLHREDREDDLSTRVLLGTCDAPEWAGSAAKSAVPAGGPNGQRVTVVAMVQFHGPVIEHIYTE